MMHRDAALPRLLQDTQARPFLVSLEIRLVNLFVSVLVLAALPVSDLAALPVAGLGLHRVPRRVPVVQVAAAVEERAVLMRTPEVQPLEAEAEVVLVELAQAQVQLTALR